MAEGMAEIEQRAPLCSRSSAPTILALAAQGDGDGMAPGGEIGRSSRAAPWSSHSKEGQMPMRRISPPSA